MAFTVEQQAEIDSEVAKQILAFQASQQLQSTMIAQQHANALELQVSSQNANAALQAAQAAASLSLQSKQSKLSAVQLAQSTLIANRSNQPADTREISASDITAYADSIVAYINS